MERALNTTVAAIQFAAQPLDPSANLRVMSDMVADAHARGARLVVLPELANTGYFEHTDLHYLAEDRDGDTIRTYSLLSRRHGVYLAAGFAEYHKGDVYNSLAFATPGGDVTIYRKRHLIFWEHYYFRPGNEPLIVQTELGRIGFAICADMMYDHIWSDYRNRIDVAVVSAAWPGVTEKTTGGVGWMLRPSAGLCDQIPARIAAKLQVPVVFANQSGPCEVRIPMMGPALPAEFAGRSAVYDHMGTRLSPGIGGEGVVLAQIGLSKEHASCVTLSG